MDLSPFIVPPKQTDQPTNPNESNVRTPYRLRKTQKTAATSNLSEKKNDDGNDHAHKSSTKAKDKPKSTAKGKVASNANSSELDAKAVPVPAPDTGMSSVSTPVIHTGILPVIPPHPPTPLAAPSHSYGSGFSALPSLTGFAASTAISAALTPTGSPGGSSHALSASKSGHTDGKNSRHTSVVIAVLVAIGVAFLILGGLIFFWRSRNRPAKRSCPTPSLPILQDAYVEQELKGDEESLFGGKECNSSVARPDSNGLYPWVPYNPKSIDDSKVTTSHWEPQTPIPTPPSRVLVSEKSRPAPPVRVPIPVTAVPHNPPVQQMQSALTRAANRVSTLSMSIYPNSPQSGCTTAGIGLAIGCPSPLTGDGTPVLQRKPSHDRMSRIRKSNRHSLAVTEYLDIYGGVQMASPNPGSGSAPSPSPLKSALRKSTSIHTNAQGRARVKAGYAPGSSGLRASSTVAGIATLGRRGDRTSMIGQTEEDMQYMLPPLSPALKSDDRRERDTRALASALGLASPAPLHTQLTSPVPTICPDDSITLAGERMHNRVETHTRVVSEAMSPGMEASARLGNLMLAEFTSMASLPSARTVAAPPPAGQKPRSVPRKTVITNAGTGGSLSSRADDRPPRVPSPPPLPSLAQMAMAHTNPEDYGDYRSPTYSIYGLYEAERKSRLPPGDAGF